MRFIPFTLFFSGLFLGFYQTGSAQNDVPIHPSIVNTGVFHGETPPLRDLPAMSQKEFNEMAIKLKNRKEINEDIERRSYPFAATALPKGPDQAWQATMGQSGSPKAPIANFNGQDSPYYPPDCNGAAGPNHYMQTINCAYAIYNKTGTLVAGPTNMNQLFSGVTGATYNDGDPLILYDEQASRWLAVEFSISGSNDYMLIAVSTTSDPTGTWYKYSFDVADMPDYEKFGIWQDGYYMADNNSVGNDIYVFQRSVMLTGGASPQMVGFNNPNRPTSIDGFMCVPPVDNDGAFAPAGAPGIFIAFNDDAIAGGTDQLWIYELAVNWTTPASSTFSRSQQLAVTAFNSNFGNDWTNIAQQGTTQQLDAIPQVIMNIPQYRNFGTYQTIVCCHTVDVDNTDHAGVRWYELRRGAQASGNWAVRQQGTYAPDANSRWMGSIALNGNGKIGLGYSVSSSALYPSIRYTGQSTAAYTAGAGIMDITEGEIQAGSYSQTGAERWGDYASISIDPADDQTFWFTTQYIGSGGARKTKIASFKFSSEPAATTIAATSVTGTTATLNGTVNPNTLATTYYFQWGTTISYGNNTTTTSAGSGSTAIAVSANLTGLTGGTPYHFRVAATNTDGTAYGSDLTFTPGAAVVTTTAASSITLNSAASGGIVTSEGGLTVTARGVCWATTANPSVAGSHTTDGGGAGTFTSSITGLLSNTLYHVRAYATNSSGTYYGNDLTFTTLCGVVSVFPWSEGFENGGLIPSCWTQEQVNSSGLNWIFVAGNGASNPATAHGGAYDACLKDVTTADNITRLITPSLNLTGAPNPTLTFWHTQAVRSTRQDQLAVYYKTSLGGTWTLITSYTTSITAWTQRTITLPNVSGDYYIAFQGNAKYGRGVCIDDVTVSTACGTTVPVSVSIIASANPVCAGSSVTFTATPTNGGTTPLYQWNVNGTNVSGATNVTYSYAPAANDAVTCVLTSNLTCITGNPATSNTVTMTVNPPSPVSVSVAAGANPVCAGTSVTFTATPTNGGTTPAYQWKVNGTNAGTNSPTYAYAAANNDVMTCVLTSNATCISGSPATSNTVTMTVNPVLPVSVSIDASGNPVDEGTPVTFTAIPVNGGVSPAYQWMVNWISVGANNISYTCTPVNGDSVSCMLTSGELCASSNPANSNAIIMVVNSTPLTVELQNIVVTGDDCFNAIQTIIVAGNATTFTVQNGGHATMIAGQNIIYYPGTVVEFGGYMDGYIAQGGPWCLTPPIAAVISGTNESILGMERQFYTIYPNPTTGMFTIELNAADTEEKCLVEIYDMNGQKMLSDEMGRDRKHEFSLAGKPSGIYLIRVIGEMNSGTTRIIKQ